jgi:hypothetical protein
MHAIDAQGRQEPARKLGQAARPRLAVPPRYARGRRIVELADALAERLGGWSVVSPLQAAAVRRAAELVCLAEASRAKHLQGDFSVVLDDIVRLDAAADRALRWLGLGKPGVQPRPATIREYLAARQTSPPGPPATTPTRSEPR